MNASLSENIDKYDGKHTDVLEEIVKKSPTHSDIAELLHSFNRNERTQEAVSWVLKAWVDQGCQIDDTLLRQWYEFTILSGTWPPVLHLVQALNTLTLSKSQAATMGKSIIEWTTHENKMVRAWSYTVLYKITVEYPGLFKNAQAILERGSKDEAPSVRARLRKIEV